ncbi:hypothetical protein F5B20DRAFT_537697 [Whalleya microplaca]|nr:hypothetical protein F5B20DRAFT_537697 [Whalleya microplaca]
MLRAMFTSLNRLPVTTSIRKPVLAVRTIQQQVFVDEDDLIAARKWHESFNEDSLPKGHTTYSRSSGPGGQHVNKTESKATTVWSVEELSGGLPTLIGAALRTSKYYTKRNDSITMQAQTDRSRSRNTEDNRLKLAEELQKIYKAQIPGETNPEKIKKHKELAKLSNEDRLKSKKQHAAKKAARKSSDE